MARWSTGSKSVRRRFSILLAVSAALLAVAGTAAADLGSSSVGSRVDGKVSGRAQSYRFTASAGVVDRLNVYLDATNAASKVVLGLYSNGSKGQPSRLRRSCTVGTAIPNAWNRCSISALTLTRGATYHLAVLGPKNTRGVRYRATADRSIVSYRSRSSSLVALPRSWSGRSRRLGSEAAVHADRVVASRVRAEKVRGGPPPTADFTWSPLNPQNPPAQVSFTNTGRCSAAPCTYRWEQPELFATTKDASFTYQSATAKTVKLTVKDAQGRVAAQSQTITVTGSAPPAPAACADTLDNDNDGAKDFPADVGCSSTTDNDESNVPEPPPPVDTDADGVPDTADNCVRAANPGQADLDGDGQGDVCDADEDGDSVSTPTDLCPRQPGPSSNNGCPVTQPGACAATGLHVPDGPDGFGGCWPGPSNTGVPAGTVLTDYIGPCTISTANTVIDSKRVNCNLTINATGVQVRNSLINGITTTNSSGSSTFTDTTIDAGEVNATFNNGPRALNGENWTAVRVEAFRGISGGWCKNCRLEDSWIHGQDRDEGGRAHQSGIRMDQNAIIRHNTLRCDAPTVPPDGGCSGDLTGYGDFAPVTNNLIERNLFMTTTGGICAYGGSSASKPYANGAANIRFVDNVFDRRADSVQPSGKCGTWGPITDFDVNAPGNLWQNNRYHDGALVGPE
jgi:Thrombospondin type 3 repeat